MKEAPEDSGPSNNGVTPSDDKFVRRAVTTWEGEGLYEQGLDGSDLLPPFCKRWDFKGSVLIIIRVHWSVVTESALVDSIDIA